ncbi:MAG: hypothetical protein V3V05_04545 [Pontiella sp.]
MFLPALLLRDMGWAGYWIFAIPNVIGAALVGWSIKSRSSSSSFVENHAAAIWWFSAITLAFHFYWILWFTNFIQAAFNIPAYYLAGCIGIVCAFALILSRFSRLGKAPQIAFVLLAFSLGVLISTTSTTDLKDASTPLFNSAQQAMAPLWMFPVMLFGFLLCPYLDITFHHARQQLDSQKNGRLGFTIGFVGFFSFMILLTTRYAGVIIGAMEGSQFSSIVPLWLGAAILIHILCQWFFTIHVHLDRMRTLSGAKRKQPMLVVLLVVSGITGVLAPRLPAYAGLAGGEIIYRLFLSAYGLIFPAYMLHRVIARRKNNTSGWQSGLWISIALAVPLFWMGFIERQTVWLIPGMALVLCGSLIQPKKRS